MPHLKKLVLHGFKSFPTETEILLDRSMNCIVGPNGSGKCLTGDSLVQLADGSLTRIDNLVNLHLNNAVKTEDGFLISGDGTEILCLDLETLKTTKKPIKAFVKRTSPKRLLKIKTRLGREIKTTVYHPLFILKNGEIKAAKAEELKSGVRIAVPRKINFNPEHKYFTEVIEAIKETDKIYVPYKEEYKLILKTIKGRLTWEQLAKKIGVSYYVIKGLLDKQSINFSSLIKILMAANLSNIEILNLIDELISNGKRTKFSFKNSKEFSRFFGYLLAEGRLAASSQIWFTNGDKEVVDDYISLVKELFNKEPLVREYKPNCWDVIIFSEPLKKVLNKLGMASKTKDKHISNTILKHSSDEEISHLLNGLYCGDGYVSKNSIEITTKSDKLAKGISTCLLRLGITYHEKNVTKRIKERGFSGEYKNIVIYGVNNFVLFHKNITLIHKEKNKKILKNLNRRSNPNLDLIEVNDLVKKISFEQEINIKKTKKEFPRIDAYVYNQCLPSRDGLILLRQNLFQNKSESLEILDKLINSEIYWDEIVEASEVNGEEWVYDLCVEGNHNFIANNIFVHNSNLTDAICFVLGRLSIKSMRAAKAANMIFAGTKLHKPASEASVSIVFDNSDKLFSIPEKEVAIKRVVRRNGQSIYKINNSTKTRQEVLELLAQAGIDPYGFNIVLQGEIDSFVKMHAEERRGIIEEVAGISVYETRKQKSFKELEKTEEKLKEVSAVLRERTSYLKNLENERQQALKFKKLEETIKKCKASILKKKLDDKEKEKETVAEEIHKKNSELDKVKINISKVNEEIKNLNNRIEEINNKIQSSSGLEQESLHNEIAELKADIAGLSVRKENFQNQIEVVSRRKEELGKNIKSSEQEIIEMRKSKGKSRKQDFEKKKTVLDEIEEKRKKFYSYKSSLSLLQERIEDKRKELQRLEQESSFIFEKIKETEISLEYKENLEKNKELVSSLEKSLEDKEREQKDNEKIILEVEKEIAVLGKQIEELESIKAQVSKIDICPLCKTKITSEHISHIERDSNEKISSLNKKIEEAEKKKNKTWELKESLIINLKEILNEIEKRERDIIKLENINEKKQYLRRLEQEKTELLQKLEDIENEKNRLEKTISQFKNIEESYDSLSLEVQELARHEEVDVGMEITLKEREIERMKLIIRQSLREKEELEEEISSISNGLEEKESLVEEKEKQEQILQIKFKKMFEEKTKIQDKIRLFESDLLKKQNDSRLIEDAINNLKIKIAELNAQHEGFSLEYKEFENTEIIKLPTQQLQEKLEKTQQILNTIGTVNLRALEVYDGIKKEYDAIAEKVSQLEKEKQEILKIVEEIDSKKKKTFNKTLTEINSLFSRNFSQLSTKGIAFLEPENKEDIFSAGLDIIIKVGKGKYFDVTSLSGGEQTLIALSLIFAIQEYNPYHFYIFDEIDAALDKRNSERLAGLLKKHMKSGQYLIITHNDALISEASTLYGVSMQEGISKVLSLQI